jgi:AraC-like DNA-binding protein
MAQGRGLAAARLRAIKGDILAHLEWPALDVSSVAKRHGVTPRYVQRLFEPEGITFSEFVRDQRLARAYRTLSDPRHAALAVSTIAYDTGFGDLSYFNRTFQRLYGMSPSDVRAAARKKPM